MQIYRTYTTPTNATAPTVSSSWQASQTEASKKRAQLKRDGFKAETQTVNIPTAKGPLIEWLNENVKS